MNKYLPYVLAVGVIGIIVAVVKGTGDEKKPTPAPSATASNVALGDPTTVKPPPPVASQAPIEDPVPGPTSVPMATLAYEAKMVTRAQAALDRGDPKQALVEIDDYEHIPEHALLVPQATMIKIAALAKVGRKTDALALAMETRSDPEYKDYHAKIEDILSDAGLGNAGPAAATPR